MSSSQSIWSLLLLPFSYILAILVYVKTVVTFQNNRKVVRKNDPENSIEDERPVANEQNGEDQNNNLNSIKNEEKKILLGKEEELIKQIHKKTQIVKRKRTHSRSKSSTSEELLSPQRVNDKSPDKNNNDNISYYNSSNHYPAPPDEDFFYKEEECEPHTKDEVSILNQILNGDSGDSLDSKDELIDESESNIIIIEKSSDEKRLVSSSDRSRKYKTLHREHLLKKNSIPNQLLLNSPQPESPAIKTPPQPSVKNANLGSSNERPRSPSFHRRSRSVVSFEAALSSSRPTCPKCGLIISTILKEEFCSKCGAMLNVSNEPQVWVDPIERKVLNHIDILIQVKGRRCLQIFQVQLHHSSLNQGDVFILDCNTKIFQWNGRMANRMEKAKATDVCLRIKEKERIGKAEIIIIEDTDRMLTVDDIYNEKDQQRYDNEQLFWRTMGGVPEMIKSEDEGGVDDQNLLLFTLYKIEENEAAQNVIKPVSYPKLMKEYLHPDGCYILDCNSEFWMWKGKKSSGKKRKDLETLGKEFFVNTSHSRPPWSSVYSIWEGSERVLFMEKFVNWGKLPINVQPAPILEVKKVEEKPFDVKQLLFTIEELNQQKREREKQIVRSGLAKRKGPPDDGKSGTVRIWRASKDSRHALRPQFYRHFWDQDSYIILYSFQYNRHDEHIIYFWQGSQSPITIKGASAVLTICLNENLDGATEQIRVPQFKESEHFISIFDYLIIHQGPTPSFALSSENENEFDRRRAKLSTSHVSSSSVSNDNNNNNQQNGVDDDISMPPPPEAPPLSISLGSINEAINVKEENNSGSNEGEGDKIEESCSISSPNLTGTYHIRNRYVVEIDEKELAYYLNANDCFLLSHRDDGGGDGSDNGNDVNRVDGSNVDVKGVRNLIWDGKFSSDVTKHTSRRLSHHLNSIHLKLFDEKENNIRFHHRDDQKPDFNSFSFPTDADRQLLDHFVHLSVNHIHNQQLTLSPSSSSSSSTFTFQIPNPRLLDMNRRKARVFLSTYSSGFYTCEEIENPCQSDFEDSFIYIVDCFPEVVFVWEGRRSNSRDKKRTFEVALEYRNLLLLHYASQFSPEKGVPIMLTKQGAEPQSFTTHFQGWRGAKVLPDAHVAAENMLVDVELELKKYNQCYTLEELQKKPSHLDLTRLEMYLSDDEFEKVFKVTKDEWGTMQAWKRTGLKKSAKLY